MSLLGMLFFPLQSLLKWCTISTFLGENSTGPFFSEGPDWKILFFCLDIILLLAVSSFTDVSTG